VRGFFVRHLDALA